MGEERFTGTPPSPYARYVASFDYRKTQEDYRAELEDSDIDMIVGGTEESVIMMEGEMQEISETEMLEAIKAGHEAIQKLCRFQEELRDEFGKENLSLKRLTKNLKTECMRSPKMRFMIL